MLHFKVQTPFIRLTDSDNIFMYEIKTTRQAQILKNKNLVSLCFKIFILIKISCVCQKLVFEVAI